MATDVERLARVRRMCAGGEARQVRTAARVSLAELGRAVGVDWGTVRHWETGERMPREAAALRYLAVLDALERETAR
jgi:DNA-binding transcriptional regulator YiaG